MKTIASKDNPVLKAARRLRGRKGREQEGAFLAEGRKLIAEALSAGLSIDCLFVNAGALTHGGISEGDWAQWPGWTTEPEVVALEEKLFYELAQTKTPQPYIAVIRKSAIGNEQSSFPSEARHALVLDRIGDPGNAGTMIRTAYAAGMEEVWCVKGTVDVFSDKVIRASAGAVFHIPVRESLSAEECIELAHSCGMKLIVCDVYGKNVYNIDMNGSVAIVVGSEGAGPQNAFLVAADAIAGIPMEEKSESLNAAIAAAIVMYEAKRRSIMDAE